MKRSEAMEMYKDSIIEEMRRAYYSVCKAHGNFSISIYVWESCPDPKPEDEEEAEKMEEELLQEVVDWYDPETVLDAEIEQAKQDEEMEEWEGRYYA